MNKLIDLYCFKYTIFIKMQIVAQTECKKTGREARSKEGGFNEGMSQSYEAGQFIMQSYGSFLKENCCLALFSLAFHTKKYYICHNAFKQED